MIEKLLLKLRARDTISAEEERALEDAVSEVREIPDNKTIVSPGEELAVSTLLLDGFLARYKDLRDGQRQITELHVPGDFADLHSFTLKRLDHNVGTLTPCKIALVPHERLERITEAFPHLTRLLWFSTNLDAAIHREWEVSLGRRSAFARVAHLFCELYHRLSIVGLTDGLSYDFALTQTDVSECLGLTAVHVNRTLRELRESDLLEFRGRKVVISNLAALQAAAEFDADYLYLDSRPR
ncbi:Crp/Fnr family transcriptional regulator [Allosphingosinicella flava]|uniref:Crp/Fnr family transcriptional regulator n=1 Tax=Allosphingosinicella flava TaxID=2771430 RepID=A0A7T2LM21_9SPHN|nr:Crp/Fnr family transcriptional regulator [Sphingosinicella flava]QPQ55091.1 Crp/Fnr family transcriptional regulator [Sphingosinicella flava]